MIFYYLQYFEILLRRVKSAYFNGIFLQYFKTIEYSFLLKNILET